jgi:hypothetical protein
MSIEPYEIVIVGDIDSPHDAIRSLLHSTLNHVAKMQMTMLEVLAARYGHSVEEMVEVLRDSEAFNPQKLALNPVAAAFLEKVEDKKEEKPLKTKKGKKVILKQQEKATS